MRNPTSSTVKGALVRHFLSGFTDPVRRPRFIIWLGIATMILVILWCFGLVGTSFNWFCEEPCHIVHYDNTMTFNAGSHSEIMCVACHEPVNASPLTYTFMKIYVLPDLWSTATRTFQMPLNPYSEVAVKMPTEQCTQCHNLDTRAITPSSGMIIDHGVHAKNDIRCTLCHNRVAHPEEDVTYVLPGDKKHENWMTMDACFRCHGLQTDAKAPGDCSECHPPGFDLVPASHEATGWYTLYGESAGHAKAAKAESTSVEAALAHKEPTEERVEGEEPALQAAATVNSCYTCHKATFCSECHGGLPMPHPAEFKKAHGAQGYENPATCAKCHARSAAEAQGYGFCNACHHPASTPDGEWLSQHPDAVVEEGASACFECHDELQCSYCHVNGVTAGRAQLKKEFAQ